MFSRKNYLLILSLTILLFFSFSFAHEGELVEHHQLELNDPVKEIFFVDSFTLVGWVFGIVVLLMFISVLIGKVMHEKGKKIFFVIIVAMVGFSTLYLAAETVFANIVSESKGPVHWHADFEVWSCGEKIELMNSEGLESKVGSSVFHHHNDLRIHVEGTVVNLKTIGLGKFFEEIGGNFSSEKFKLLKSDGTVLEKSNGDLCNGVSGKVQAFLFKVKNPTSSDNVFEFEQSKLENFEDYVLSPYTLAPPGDCIIVEFDLEKNSTDKLCNSYAIAIQNGTLMEAS